MIRFEQNRVYRSITKSSKLVCNFLQYIHQQGFTKAPKYHELNDEEYILSYIEGKTYNLDYPVASEEMLISSAKLLREYHDISEKFIKSDFIQEDGWMFESHNHIEIIFTMILHLIAFAIKAIRPLV